MESQQDFWMKTSSGFADLQPSLLEELSVGPGQYTLQSFIPSGPSYSFPHASRFLTPPRKNSQSFLSMTPEKWKNSSQGFRKNRSNSPKAFINDSPGPGEYNVPSSLVNKKISIGGKFKDDPPNNYPGPGSYNIELKPNLKFPQFKDERMKAENSVTSNVEYVYSEFKSSSPSYSIGRRNRSSSPPNTPGVGAYEIKSTLSNTGFTINPKRDPPQGLNTPAPGAYSLNLQKSAPTFSIGLPIKDPKPSNNPGPGEYFTDLKPSGPKYSIGLKIKEKEEIDNRDIGIIKSSFEAFQGKGAIFLGKYKDEPENGVPGPGSYSPEKVKTKMGLALIKSSRDEKLKDGPGPGDYSPERVSSGAPSFSIGKKLSPQRVSEVPGPGHYNTPPKSANAPMLRGKPKDVTPPKVPGPGEYQPIKPYSSQAYSQSRSNRFQEISESPGPGEYSPELRKSGPKYSMGSRASLSNTLSESPGPGEYTPALLNSKSFVSIRGKPSDPAPLQVPGPGTYNTERLSKSPSFPFGLKAEQNFDNNVPGPGTYSFEGRTGSPSWTIGERRDRNKSEAIPGPGAYEPKLSSSLITFTFGQRRNQKIEMTPGPGEYQSSILKSSGISFGKRLKEKLQFNPGPGTYDPKLRSSNPAWSILARQKTPLKEDQPGPGHYTLNMSSSTQAFSFSKLERKFSPSKTPAPTDYSPEKSCLKDSIRYSCGKSQRIDFTKLKTSTPGPGSYYREAQTKVLAGKFGSAKRESRFVSDTQAPYLKIEPKPLGPFFSINGKRKEKKTQQTPGPGSYQVDLQFKPSSPAYSMGARRSLHKKKSLANYTPVRVR